jgi:hypothetical protein
MARFIARAWRSTLIVGGAAALLLGCPLYEDTCDSRNDCRSGYQCNRFTQRCEQNVVEVGCLRPDQCGPGETCTPDFTCRPGSCQFHGCVGGFSCGVQGGAHACLSDGAISDAGDAAADPGPSDIDASLGPDAAGSIDAGGLLDASSSDAGDAAADASP